MNDHATPIWAAATNNHIDVVRVLSRWSAPNFTSTEFDNVTQLSLPPIEIKKTQDIWPCAFFNDDALVCIRDESIRYLTKLPNTTAPWDVLRQDGDTFICTPLANSNLAMHCVGEKVEYIEWSMQSELKVEFHAPTNTSPDVLMTLSQATMSGVVCTVLPEAIGDLLVLLDFLTEANSQRFKLLMSVLLVMMTGSWLGVTLVISLNFLLQKVGCTEQVAKASGNAAAYFVNAGLKVTPIGIAAGVFNYTAGQLGVFFEKRGVSKLQEITEGCIDVNNLVINL